VQATSPLWYGIRVAVTVLKRLGIFVAVLLGLCAFYMGYRQLYLSTGWTRPFKVDEYAMPRLQDIISRLWEPAATEQPALVHVLLDKALFTAREAAAGFVIGAIVGIAIGTVFHFSNLLRRGFQPYVVGSQTVPILAIAPMIIVVLGTLGIDGLLPKAVISMYLCFFPVAIGMVKGLRSPEPLQLDLMRTYSASPAQVFWKLRWPSATHFLFASLKIAAATSLVGAIVGELPTGAQAGLGARLLSGSYFGQTVQIWSALAMASLVGIALVAAIGLVERVVARRMGEAA
jgi:NitT/TauT family transport system permease protein